MKNTATGKTRKATMKDVAGLAKVSVTTVSHVLNRTRFVSPQVTGKVEKAVADLGFKVNPIAKNLRSGKSQIIGFVVSNLQHYFYTSLARGMKEAVNSAGYRLVLADSAECTESEIEIVESFYLRGLDGIILAPSSTDCSYLHEILPDGYPVVFVDRPATMCQNDCILLNNVRASYEATQYLLASGYRKIAYLTYYFTKGKIDETTLERREGYRQALRDANHTLDESLIKLIPSRSLSQMELLEAESYSIAREFVAASVDAVLCGNSLSASGLYRYLCDADVQIPEEMALITFDNDAWLSLVSPQITSVTQPAEQMGELAAKQLLKRIHNQDATLQQEILRLDANLIHRGSC